MIHRSYKWYMLVYQIVRILPDAVQMCATSLNLPFVSWEVVLLDRLGRSTRRWVGGRCLMADHIERLDLTSPMFLCCAYVPLILWLCKSTWLCKGCCCCHILYHLRRTHVAPRSPIPMAPNTPLAKFRRLSENSRRRLARVDDFNSLDHALSRSTPGSSPSKGRNEVASRMRAQKRQKQLRLLSLSKAKAATGLQTPPASQANQSVSSPWSFHLPVSFRPFQTSSPSIIDSSIDFEIAYPETGFGVSQLLPVF